MLLDQVSCYSGNDPLDWFRDLIKKSTPFSKFAILYCTTGRSNVSIGFFSFFVYVPGIIFEIPSRVAAPD